MTELPLLEPLKGMVLQATELHRNILGSQTLEGAGVEDQVPYSFRVQTPLLWARSQDEI